MLLASPKHAYIQCTSLFHAFRMRTLKQYPAPAGDRVKHKPQFTGSCWATHLPHEKRFLQLCFLWAQRQPMHRQPMQLWNIQRLRLSMQRLSICAYSDRYRGCVDKHPNITILPTVISGYLHPLIYVQAWFTLNEKHFFMLDQYFC